MMTDKATGWAGQTAGEKAFSLLIAGVSTAVSIAFAYYLFSDPARLTQAWEWVRALPWFLQALVWLLALPWMIALWVWVQPWAVLVRVVVIVAVLLFTEFLVYPFK